MNTLVEQWSTTTKHIGKQVRIFDCVESTNTRALALDIDPAHDGTVIVAQRQTAGRGQYGRVWDCPADSGILMSVLLFPPAAIRRPALMTALAAVVVAETIRETTELDAGIKWPNDLLMRGKKVCGILIEQGRGVVIGIGLNLNQSEDDFREMGLPDATSLSIQCGQMIDARHVLRRLIVNLDTEYDRLLAGRITNLESCWRWRLGLVDRRVTIEKMDGATVKGVLRELGFQGVHLSMDVGEHLQIAPEMIRHIHAEK
jgi:BirA family biotin operon repressor/biotin-[acetyl-CoA-carboxylase] ligase